MQNCFKTSKNVFMIEEDALEIFYCSFKQIRSSMTKLWGKDWPLYHFTPTKCRFPMHACILTKQVRLLFLACGSDCWLVTLKNSLHHISVLHCVGVKWYRCQTLPHNLDMDDWIWLKLEQVIYEISFSSAMKSILILLKLFWKNIGKRGGLRFFWDTLYNSLTCLMGLMQGRIQE